MKTTKRIFMTLFAVVSMVTGVCLFAPKTTEVQAASVKSEILEELMNVKMQLKKNANTSYDVRMVFGIDNLEDYQAVGFEVYYNNAKKPITVRSTSVRTNLEAISYGYQYKYSPKAMSTEAEYFAVATIKGVNASKTDKLFYVVPFVEMNDAKGTIKYGAGRCFSVNDGLTETYVNMTIPTDNALSAKDIIDVTLAGEKVSATVLKSVDDYAFVNVSLPNGVSKKTDLKAVSKVTYDGETTYYRNFHTATVASDEADTSWYDAYDAETTNKYVIATREELYGLAYLANHGNALRGKTIYLVSDITVNQASMDPADYATGAWATEETKFVKWVPIAGGDSSIVNVGFAGTFDGQDHTISGLYMKSDGAYLGLFATTAADGSSTIKNLKLTNSYFECTRTTGINGNELEGLGSIIGQGAGLIDTVYSDAIVVSGFKNVGGFVGNQRLNDTQLTIQNSWFDGKVTGTQWVGGLVGFSYAYVGSTNLMNCLVTADLTATATAQDTAYIGGIAGRISKGEISSCVAQGTITVPSTEHYPAGIVRTIVNAGSVTLKDIYNAMEWKGTLVTNHHYPNRNDSNVVQVNGESLNGQNAYLNTTLDFYEEQYNENGKWVAIKENELLQLKSFADKDKIDGLTDVARAKTITADISWYNDEDTEFTINTVEELYGFAQLSNTGNKFAGITIKLGKDIVVNKASMNPEDYATGEWTAAETNFVKWIPIAGGDTSNVNVGFAGIFDGQGHTISGLYMKSEGLYLGLFATLATDGSSTIKDLKLTNSYFECTRETANVNELDGLGSIAGQGAGLIDTVYSDAIVVSRCRNVGGFIGNQRQDNAPLTIQNCWFNGKVTGTQWVGGLIGFVATGVAYTNMADCLVTAELTSTATASDTAYIGGLSGRFSKGEIRSCVAQGTIVTTTSE